ncbi:MAG: ectonucleotide pyrophosphatase/phosphodiesterase [Verrucomicrobiota bacterium]
MKRIALFLSLTLWFLSPATSPAASPRERTVILISVDGLAHYYFDDPKAHMPTIRRLAREGARAERMQSSFPTVTWPNHTALVTGVHPGRHGVIGNNYYDRTNLKSVPLIPDPLFDKDQIVKTPTIYDVAKAAGLKTAGVIWPATRNAKTLDWTVPDVFEQELFEKYGTPSLLQELRAKGIPYDKQMEWCKAGNAGKAQRDWMYTRIAEHILLTHQPNFLALHLVTLDSFEHATGRQTPEAYWACNDSDNRVREIVEAVEAAGLKERTAFFITADHGFITFTNQINPNVLLKNEGLLKIAGTKIAEQRAYCLSQGGGAFIYVLDTANRDQIIASLKPKLAALEGVEEVVGPERFAEYGHVLPSVDPREPDILLAAKDGYSFSDTFAPKDVVTPVNPPKGTHGYSHKHPLMDATFVASGAGIKNGVTLKKMSNLDVAPTMARVLGLEMKNTDGRVLTEILK